MALRLIGIITIIISTTSIGFWYSFKDDFRIIELNEVKKMISILHSEIEFGLSTIPEALENISYRIEEPLLNVIKRMLEMINSKNGIGIAEIWKEGFSRITRSYLRLNDIENIISMGKTLGYIDKELQVRGINQLIDYIDKEIEVIYENNTRLKKMYQSMGVLSGLLVVIIML